MSKEYADELLKEFNPALSKEVKDVSEEEIEAFISNLDPVGSPTDEKVLGKFLSIEVALLVIVARKHQVATLFADEHNAFVDTEVFQGLDKDVQYQKFHVAKSKMDDMESDIQLLTDTVWNGAKKRLNYDERLVEYRKDGVLVAPTIPYPVCPHCRKRHPKSGRNSFRSALFGDGMEVVVIRM